MSETPERIEREMFEIRSKMSADVTDLRQHVDPQRVSNQVKETARGRVQSYTERLRTQLQEQQREITDSAKFQLDIARSASEKRDTAPLQDAIKNDPRPLIVLSIVLALTVSTLRRVFKSRDDD